MIVRELVTRLGFAVNDTQLTKYQRGTENIKRSAEGAAESFRNMFVAFAGFQALKSLADVADNVQSLEARMAQMVQTGENVGATFDTVSAHATASRQNLSAYANLYIRIGNASQELITDQAQLLGIIDTISQALVVGGVASSEQASAMLQLSQAFNKGKLDGDEFKAVMEAMPPAFTRSLAAAMGYNDGLKSFYEASSKGQLTIESLITAIQKIGPGITDQFVAMPITISQSMTIIGNRFQTFVARMNRESGAVTNVANTFIAGFNLIESALNKVVDFFGGATQTLKFFAIAITALVIPALIKLGIGFVALLASPAGILIAALILLGLVLEDVYQYFTGGISLLGSMDAWVRNLTIGLGLFTAAVALFGVSGVAAFASFAIAVIAATWPILLLIAALAGAMYVLYLLWDNWQTIWAGMKDIADKVWQGLVDGFGIAIDKIKSAWNGFKSFFGMGVSTTVSATQAAGAASSAGGVPTAGGSSNVTINQTLPAGSPEATKVAAREGAQQAMDANPTDKLARQMAQAQ